MTQALLEVMGIEQYAKLLCLNMQRRPEMCLSYLTENSICEEYNGLPATAVALWNLSLLLWHSRSCFLWRVKWSWDTQTGPFLGGVVLLWWDILVMDSTTALLLHSYSSLRCFTPPSFLSSFLYSEPSATKVWQVFVKPQLPFIFSL